MSFRVLLSNCHTRRTPGCRSLFRWRRIFCPPSSVPHCNVIENCWDAFEVASLQKENTVSLRRYCHTIMIMEIFSRLSRCFRLLLVHRTLLLMSFITDYLLIFVDAFWINTRLEKNWSKWSPAAAAYISHWRRFLSVIIISCISRVYIQNGSRRALITATPRPMKQG